MSTFESFTGSQWVAVHDLGMKFDAVIGRIAKYKALAGRSNCPYERAALEVLILEERENAAAFRRALEGLTGKK